MFTDTEHRILLAAMTREEMICKRIDKEEPGEVSLTSICNSINRKIHNIQYKYRWHDICKNPDDLPPANLDVLIATKYYRYEKLKYSYYIAAILKSENEYYWEYDDGCVLDNDAVVAWREIEPFEEEL